MAQRFDDGALVSSSSVSFKELNYEPGTIGGYFYAVQNCDLRYKIKH